MKYRLSVLFLLIILSSFLTTDAQDTDSISFVTAKWEKRKIACKSKLVTHHFDQKNLFGSNQHISYVIVKKRIFAPRFHIAAENKQLRNNYFPIFLYKINISAFLLFSINF